jgi:hypothetical protein
MRSAAAEYAYDMYIIETTSFKNLLAISSFMFKLPLAMLDAITNYADVHVFPQDMLGKLVSIQYFADQDFSGAPALCFTFQGRPVQ